MRFLLFALAILPALPASAQTAVRYTVTPEATNPSGVSRLVRVTLTLPADAPRSPITFVMPERR